MPANRRPGPLTRLTVTVLAAVLMWGGAMPAANGDAADAQSRSADATVVEEARAGVRPVPGHLMRPFDPPEHPYGPGHRGVDLAAEAGTPVRAVRAGVVRWAAPVAGAGWVTLDHGRGLHTTYGVVEPAVPAGRRVRAGQVIGFVAPGRAHLDWGARWHRRGGRTYLDPLTLLVDLRPVLVAPLSAAADDPGGGGDDV